MIGYPSANHQNNKVMKHEFTVHWERVTTRGNRSYSRTFEEKEKAIGFARKKDASAPDWIVIRETEVEEYETGNNAPGIKDGVRVKILGFVEF